MHVLNDLTENKKEERNIFLLLLSPLLSKSFFITDERSVEEHDLNKEYIDVKNISSRSFRRVMRGNLLSPLDLLI